MGSNLDFEAVRDRQAAWIAEMARTEGFKDYARQRLVEIQKDKLFEGLSALVKQKLDKKPSSASVND